MRVAYLILLTAGIAAANVVFSETGTLANSTDTKLIDLLLPSSGDVVLQTYGFGGGTNAAGTVILAGGFDPFVGLFQGVGAGATFVNGTSDILTSYSPGCPPAGLVTVGAVTGQCGDVLLQFTGLSAGNYTVLVSDGSYVPEAVFESAPAFLGDGFVDLTGGVFQTCADLTDCNTDTGNWALDITAPDGASIVSPITTPEPVLSGFAAAGLAALFFVARLKHR